MGVCTCPFDRQRTAFEMHRRFARAEPAAVGSGHGGAGARSACSGLTDPPLPNAHVEMIWRQNLHKFHICPRRKQRMFLNGGPEDLHRRTADIFYEKYAVR